MDVTKKSGTDYPEWEVTTDGRPVGSVRHIPASWSGRTVSRAAYVVWNAAGDRVGAFATKRDAVASLAVRA